MVLPMLRAARPLGCHLVVTATSPGFTPALRSPLDRARSVVPAPHVSELSKPGESVAPKATFTMAATSFSGIVFDSAEIHPAPAN